MNKELVKISKTLFATYVGLTASGYDMADYEDEDIRKIIDSIRKEEWPDDVIMYFSKARTGRCEVNPYWPMASLLSTASLRMQEDSLLFRDKDTFVESFRNANNISPEEKGPEVREWILMLPNILDKVIKHHKFDALWNDYQDILMARLEKYVNTLSAVNTLFLNTLGISESELPWFYYIPNLLQAPYIADYEADDEAIGIIQNIPSTMAVIHEALHIILKPYRNSILKGLESIPVHLIADIDKMKSLGYAWSDDVESRNNIIEESFVRAASLWVAYRDDMAEAERVTSNHAADGFTIVPALLRCLRNNWRGFANIEEVLIEYFSRN